MAITASALTIIARARLCIATGRRRSTLICLTLARREDDRARESSFCLGDGERREREVRSFVSERETKAAERYRGRFLYLRGER